MLIYAIRNMENICNTSICLLTLTLHYKIIRTQNERSKRKQEKNNNKTYLQIIT